MAKSTIYGLTQRDRDALAGVIRRDRTRTQGFGGGNSDGVAFASLDVWLTINGTGSGGSENYTATLYDSYNGTAIDGADDVKATNANQGDADPLDADGIYYKVLGYKKIGSDWRYIFAAGGGDGGPGGTISRFKVTSVGSDRLTCVLRTGSTDGTGGTDVIPIQGHAANDIIYAAASSNGTDVSGVTWVEVFTPTKSTDKFKVFQIIDTTGRIGLDWIRAH